MGEFFILRRMIMEEKEIEKINDKLIGIITLLSFIDSKLGVIIDKMSKSSPYQSVLAQNHYRSITCSDDD
jgi:hypothetical protein